MASFSITDAATAGFRIARRKPTALVVWAGVALASIIVTMLVFLGISGSDLRAAAQALETGALEDPAQAQAIFAPLLPAYAAALFITLVANCILMPAIYRAVLQPEVRTPGYLKFGLAEVRQFVVLAAIFVLVTAIDVAIGAAVNAISGGAGPVAFAGSLASFLLIVFLMVRLSLSGPDTLARGRISLAGSWRLSKPIYTPLFLTYALVVLFQVMLFASMFIVMGVVMAISTAASGLGAIGTGVIALLTVAYLVVVCMIYALSVAVTAAPAAVVYQAVAPSEPGQV